MTLDAEMATVIGSVSGLVFAIASSLVGYGILREKVRQLEDATKEDSKKLEHYVTFKHFDAIITPLQSMVAEIRKDIKTLILFVRSNQRDDDEEED